MKAAKWTLLLLVGALCFGPLYGHDENLDPDSGTVTMGDSSDVEPTPGGGGTVIVVNPVASCRFDPAPSGLLEDAYELYLSCIEAGIGGGYYAHRTASHASAPDKLQFRIGNLGGTLPDLQVIEQDPNIQTLTIELPLPDMQLRIGGFAQNPSPVGGDVFLTIDGVTVSISTTGIPSADLATKALRDALVSAGFVVQFVTKPGPVEIIVLWTPAGEHPQTVKLQIQDPALIKTDLRFEPYAGPPRGL